jgi:hypothetical protein
MARQFGETAHRRVDVCAPVLISGLRCDLLIEVGETGFRPVDPRRELVLINDAVGESIDQAFDLQSRALALKRQGMPPAEAGKRLTAEITAQYLGWSNVNLVESFVERVCEEN